MKEPLFLKPVMQEKIWGGERLRTVFGYDLPSSRTGECWAISAHPNGVATVENGVYAGEPLDKLYREHRELFGQDTREFFPLLTKILDAEEWLSVQVHPDDEYALEHEGELGKTECWYVLSAEKGAEIIYGHQAKSTEEFRQKMESGNWEELFTRIAVQEGDFFYVPSGTIHAIGKGIMILETQQSSDTTYRVYDFERKDSMGQQRELHLEKSVDVLTIGSVQNSHPDTILVGDSQLTTLVSNSFFTVYKWIVKGTIEMKRQASYYLVSVIGGEGSLVIDSHSYSLTKGQHFILPTTIESWKFVGEFELIVSHP